MRKLLFWMISSMLFLMACNNEGKENKEAPSTGPAKAETKQAPAEFADAKYAQVGKSALAALTAGDIDKWSAEWADNIVWQYNNGDSLAGKKTLTDYWKNRRVNVIDSISFSNEIWLPVKVNQPQQMEAVGVWLLGWYMVKAKYKTGKSMSQWMHVDYHFDANDKIDRVIQYRDQVPINAAMTK